MAILIDAKGLFRGKRARKLSGMARLYYPYVMAMVNFYARLELDEEIITHELSLLRVDGLDESKVSGYFDEYCNVGLAMKYIDNNSTWVQFDTPLAMRADYPSKADGESPVPPEPEYTEWLKSLHGDKWPDYHLSEYQRSISEMRSEAGKKGAAVSNAKRWGNQESEKPQQSQQTVSKSQQKDFASQQSQQSQHVVVGVDVVGVEEVEERVDVEDTLYTVHTRTPENTSLSTSTASTCTKSKDNNKSNNPVAERLANEWLLLMEQNPYFDAKFKPKLSVWVDNFAHLLNIYSESDLRDILAFSQSSDPQMRYNYILKKLCENHEVLSDRKDKLKKKPAWMVFWRRYCSITGYVPPEDSSETVCDFCELNPCKCRRSSSSPSHRFEDDLYEVNEEDDDDELI